MQTNEFIYFIFALVILVAISSVIIRMRKAKSRAVTQTMDKQIDPTSFRITAAGAVVGYADKHHTHAWLGIPYAQAPVGALRWKAPRAMPHWLGTKETVDFSPIAMQFAGVTVNAPQREWGQIVGSEDCLYLNVFAPRRSTYDIQQLPPAKRLPVMVWIHGGANTAGTAAAYAMLRNLAGKDQIVVVSMNYRLGIFGWFSLPELAQESDTAEDKSGNYGTLDIIASLKWVKQNCAAFGGDPDNVTIFGESAGALNVYTMLASPLAKGLFHKAILQSPLITSFSMQQAQNFCDKTIDPAATGGHSLSSRELLRKWLPAAVLARGKNSNHSKQQDDIGALLIATPAAQLLAAITPAALGFYDVPTVFRDGTVMPELPMQELFKQRNNYNVVPVIIGTNRDEYKLFMSQNPEFVHLYFGKIPVIKNKAEYDCYASYMSDLWKAHCVDEPASSMLESGHPDVWVYRFDWDDHPAIPLIQPVTLLGAAHVLEVPFVMRDLDNEFNPFNTFTKHNLAGRRQVSDAIAGYWTTFAKTGQPNQVATMSSTQWLPWTLQRGSKQLMVFNTEKKGGIRMIELQLSQDQLKKKLAQDLRFNDRPVDRIKMYARMFSWSIFANQVSEAEFSQFATVHGAPVLAEDFKPGYWP